LRELKPPIRDAELGEHLPLDEYVREVIKLCIDETKRVERDSIGTEHLLLAIINEFKGLGAQILREHRLDHGKLTSAVEKVVGETDPGKVQETWARAIAVGQATAGIVPNVSGPRCPSVRRPSGTAGRCGRRRSQPAIRMGRAGPFSSHTAVAAGACSTSSSRGV
jgi:Clp amino terminal domain, pathogenicity island component